MPERERRESAFDDGRIVPLPPCPDFAEPSWMPTAENCSTVVLSRAGRYRFVRVLGRWYFYERGCWRWDESATLEKLIGDTLVEISGKKKRSDQRQLESLKMVSLIERRLRAQLPATSDQWDRDRYLLNTPLGAVEMRHGIDLREHRRHDYCTRIAAAGPKGDCPLWRKHLAFITCGDAELEAYLQRAVGYTLTGSVEEQCLFFLYGTGDNGKGVFVSTIAGVMGDYAQSAAMETFTQTRNERHPEELAVLKGARMVTASETESGKSWTEARLKLLTGGDKVRAHLMRQDSFEFLPQFKLWIMGNHRPSLSANADPAMKRRLQIIPFNAHVSEADKDRQLGERLKEEWPGIMMWAVEGCCAWLQDGLRPPDAVLAATRDYLFSEDVVGAWIDECLEEPQGTKPDDWTSAHAYFTSWKAYAEASGERVRSQRWLTQQLALREGFLKFDRTAARGFYGPRVKGGQSEAPFNFGQGT